MTQNTESLPPSYNKSNPEYILADVYLGPVDFVEDNVEKLDQKVRKFFREKCANPQTPELRVECFNRGLFDFPAVGECSELAVADTESGERIKATALTDRGELFVGTETDTFSALQEQFEGDTLGLYKINIGFSTSTGEPVCELEASAEIKNESNLGTVVADTDEGLYVGTKDKVRKYNFNLGQEWTADPNGTTEKIAIGPDGRVYAGGRDDLDAINPTNGTVLGPIASPTWGLCGNKDDFVDNLFYGERDNVYYLNKRDNMGADTVAEVVSCDADDGTVNWRTPVKVPVIGAPTDTFSAMVPGDSTLFVRGESQAGGNRNGKLIAYNLDGDSKWDESYGGNNVDHFNPLLVRENGLVYGSADTIGSTQENLLMVVDGTDTETGEFKSKFTVSDSQIFPWVLGEDAGYVGTFEISSGKVFEFSFSSLSFTPVLLGNEDFTPLLSRARPVALNNGNLVVIHDSTKISSFSVTSEEFTESLWPIVNGNNQNNRSVSDF